MKTTLLFSLLLLASCSTASNGKQGGVGASATQSATQQAADEISNPAMPATQLPPAGTPIFQPTVTP